MHDFHGTLDEARLRRWALTPDEVAAIRDQNRDLADQDGGAEQPITGEPGLRLPFEVVR